MEAVSVTLEDIAPSKGEMIDHVTSFRHRRVDVGLGEGPAARHGGGRARWGGASRRRRTRRRGRFALTLGARLQRGRPPGARPRVGRRDGRRRRGANQPYARGWVQRALEHDVVESGDDDLHADRTRADDFAGEGFESAVGLARQEGPERERGLAFCQTDGSLQRDQMNTPRDAPGAAERADLRVERADFDVLDDAAPAQPSARDALLAKHLRQRFRKSLSGGDAEYKVTGLFAAVDSDAQRSTLAIAPGTPGRQGSAAAIAFPGIRPSGP